MHNQAHFGGFGCGDQPPYAVPCYVFRESTHSYADRQLHKLATATASHSAGQTPGISSQCHTLTPDVAANARSRSFVGKSKSPTTHLQDRPRVHGKFATTSQVTYHDLTEAKIRPLMKYCRVTAADMLSCSMYQLKTACKMLNLKWPHKPEIQTPEHHKALNRKKKKERIPKTSAAFLYCEKEEERTTRFHELRISSNGLVVFARFGRIDLRHSDYRANKKTHFDSREEALRYCEVQRDELLDKHGWTEKAAPTWPNGKLTSRQKAQLSLQSKRKEVKAQLALLESMRDANRARPGTHSPQEVGDVLKKFDSLRSSMHREARKSKGLVEATRAQRDKVRDMKKTNSERPGTYSLDDLTQASDKLRELMCKHSKRTLIPSSQLKTLAESELRRKIRQMKEANRQQAGSYSPDKIENEMRRLREVAGASSKEWSMGLRGSAGRKEASAHPCCASVSKMASSQDAEVLLGGIPEDKGALLDAQCGSQAASPALLRLRRPQPGAPSKQASRKRDRSPDGMPNASDAKSKCAGVTRKRACAGPRACAGAVALETCPLDALLRTSGRAGLDSEGDDWREYATLEGSRWAARHLVSLLFVHSLDFFCDAGMCLLTFCRQGRAML